VEAYRARLRDVRAIIVSARAAQGSQRDALLEQARVLLRRTTEVETAYASVPIDDGPLAARLNGDTTARDVTELDRYIAFADAAVSRRVDVAAADARLRERDREVGSFDLALFVGSLVDRFAAWVYDRLGRPSPRILTELQAIAGVLIGLAVIGLIVRGVRQRIRHESALGLAAAGRRADPLVHLRAADDALRAGRVRDAIHHLYLYAFAALDDRQAIRYDPALTDRELLNRAAGIPHADALGDLVQLHERIWFGLRDARPPDAARARSLAVEVAG